MKFGQAKIPPAFFYISISYLLYALIYTPNFWITAPLVFFPLLAYKLLWVPRQLNVLFWGMMLQWMAVFLLVFYSNLLGKTLLEYFGRDTFNSYPPLMNMSVFLSTVALYFFLFGLFLGIRKLKIQRIESALDNYPVRNLFVCYVVVSLIVYSLSVAIWALPGLVQYIFHLFEIKWGFYVIVFYKVHKSQNRQYRLYLYIVILIEFVLGLSSFFANSFLNILLFTLIAVSALQPKLKFRQYAILLLVVGLIFHLSVLWTVAKKDYRQFVNKGNVNQVVEVSQGEAIGYLFELVQHVDAQNYQRGIDEMVFRLGYTYYFSLALNYVPNVLNYEYGSIYWDAITFFITPRFLFPDKEVLDDSQHLTKYTGHHFNGAEQGSSFSLGYVPDAYVDFGPYFMFIEIFFFGLLFGVFYSFLYRKSFNVVWAWILTTPFFLLVNIYGSDTKKALGGLLLYFLTIALLRRILIKRIDPFIRARGSDASVNRVTIDTSKPYGA